MTLEGEDMDLCDAITIESHLAADEGDTVPGAGSAGSFDRMVELLALSRVRLSLVALEFADVAIDAARGAALAACGATGFLIALGSQRFVIVDVGPRGASPRADQAIAERVRALAMAALSGRGEWRLARLRTAELHLCSDQVGAGDLRLAQLARMLAQSAFQSLPRAAQSQPRRDKPDRLSLVA